MIFTDLCLYLSKLEQGYSSPDGYGDFVPDPGCMDCEGLFPCSFLLLVLLHLEFDGVEVVSLPDKYIEVVCCDGFVHDTAGFEDVKADKGSK